MSQRVTIGEISGVYGIKGWVRIHSFTQPRENVLKYSPWQLQHRGQTWNVAVLAGRRQGKGVVARIEGIDTRDQAEALKGAQISIAREQLPDLPPGEYYWTDLIGLRVIDTEGRDLGQVANLLETGANDVLIVRGAGRREILIPWIRDRVIRKVDLAAGRIEVDWDPDY